MNFEKVIYLDADYVSAKYEEESGISPETAFSKEQSAGVEAGAASSGLKLAATAQTKETRTFKISSIQMIREIWSGISGEYGRYQSGGFENYQGTKVLWIEGVLTIAEWKNRGSDEGYEFYQLTCDGERFALLTKPAYFSPGFGEIFQVSAALKGNIQVPVKCLARVMWRVEDAKNYTAYPYVIVESAGTEAGIKKSRRVEMSENQKGGVKGLDIVGGALILLGILWAVFFPAPRYEEIGSYSIAQLFPMILGVSGLICVAVSRFKK